LSDTPSGSGLVTDAKDIVGTWQKPSGSYSQFKEDGTYRSASTLEGLAERPRTIGEFWFEDGQFFKKEIEVRGIPSCGSAIGIYEAQLLENVNLEFTIIEDECASRAGSTKNEVYKRVD